MRGISLPATQLFVIAIENILRGVCGQFNEDSRDGVRRAAKSDGYIMRGKNNTSHQNLCADGALATNEASCASSF